MSPLCTSNTTRRGFFPALPYPSFWVEQRARRGEQSVNTFVRLKVTAADLWREGGTFQISEQLRYRKKKSCMTFAGFLLWNRDGVLSSGRSLTCAWFSAPSCGSSRCHCRHGIEATTHPAPFIGHIVSQMFRMRGALSARMFGGLAAKGDIWWLMCSDVNAAPSVLWAAAAPQRHKWEGEREREREKERRPGTGRFSGGGRCNEVGGRAPGLRSLFLHTSHLTAERSVSGERKSMTFCLIFFFKEVKHARLRPLLPLKRPHASTSPLLELFLCLFLGAQGELLCQHDGAL